MRTRALGRGLEVSAVGLGTMGFSHGYGHVREHLDASLARLGTDHVELCYLHRVPDTTPVEDIAAVMGELIDDGRIGGWGSPKPPRTRSAGLIP